jgi:hypothetical protein
MSKGESSTSMTCRAIATSKGSRMEMGRDRNGFYHRTAKNLEGIRLHLGYRGWINKGCLFLYSSR